MLKLLEDMKEKDEKSQKMWINHKYDPNLSYMGSWYWATPSGISLDQKANTDIFITTLKIQMSKYFNIQRNKLQIRCIIFGFWQTVEH